jgi:hypothetical protein
MAGSEKAAVRKTVRIIIAVEAIGEREAFLK